MSQICSCCGDRLKDSKHYEVICRDATDHEEHLERVDDLENKDKEKKDESRKAEEHDKMIEELKNALRKLTSEELDEEKEKLRDEIAKLRAQLEELNPEDKEDEEKQSRKASLEYLAVEPQRHNKILGDHLLTGASVTHQSNYSVLMLDQSYHDKKPGDKLLIRLGSVD
ncbi:MAG: hypothetical protein IIA82_09135 [Thaumarchaeota archaeon]|nr:hypothetical protein [Nitrososphaerota archaeon]